MEHIFLLNHDIPDHRVCDGLCWVKVISHEPKFLNKICTHVWILETQKSTNVDRLLLLLTSRVGLSHTRFVDSPVLPGDLPYGSWPCFACERRSAFPLPISSYTVRDKVVAYVDKKLEYTEGWHTSFNCQCLYNLCLEIHC